MVDVVVRDAHDRDAVLVLLEKADEVSTSVIDRVPPPPLYRRTILFQGCQGLPTTMGGKGWGGGDGKGQEEQSFRLQFSSFRVLRVKSTADLRGP